MTCRRILVVEDDDALRQAIVSYLRTEFYIVDQARTCAAALEQMRQAVPDVVLLDLILPDSNGQQFVTTYRQNPRLAAVPCVILSGAPELPAAARTIDARAALAKPVDLDVLSAVINKICRC
jgi:DNA-binding response OmpR family regulator